MTLQSTPVDVIASQLASVQLRFPDARIESTREGQRLLIVPNVSLRPGWNKDRVTLRVLVPAGFPHVKPDCFYTDPDLRLHSGGVPVNGNLQ